MIKAYRNLALACLLLSPIFTHPAAAASRHNVILFVPDGLRADIVTPQTAPAMAAVRDQGVDFRNPHSLFPTFTTANASAFATGHYLGDTGDYSNVIYTGFPVPGAGNSLTPFLESDPVLGDVDEHFAGDYLDETTLLKAARDAGISTAAIGKLGPTLIFDHTDRSGAPTIVVDDQTGSPAGIPLSDAMKSALAAAELAPKTPGRGDNGKAGNATTPGTHSANVEQQSYFVDVATKVVLPMFKAANKPFALVFWSRDPDGTQHNQGDSLGSLTPGINGPTTMAAIKNVDDDLARLRKALTDLGLSDTTDIVIAADHGFSTISKQSSTSPSAKADYKDVAKGQLPPGFLAIDIAKALGLPLSDPDAKNAAVADGTHPKRANGLIGSDPANADVVVAANGGSDLVYLPKADKALAKRVVAALLAQDYVSGLFVDQRLGHFAGALTLADINLNGSAVTPMPAIVVNFRTRSTGCATATNCGVEIADTLLQQGQGMHGSFSRADTKNFMAAIGPDFRKHHVSSVPASNADVGRTLASILGLKIAAHGHLLGRVLSEAMPGGARPVVERTRVRSRASAAGLRTVLDTQTVGRTRYFDAAGFPGRTLGLGNSE